MTYSDLIPKFEVGERVIVNFHEYEIVCPVCQKHPRGWAEPFKDTGTILEPIKLTTTLTECGHSFEPTKGNYWVELDSKGWIMLIPYPLLERVEVRG